MFLNYFVVCCLAPISLSLSRLNCLSALQMVFAMGRHTFGRLAMRPQNHCTTHLCFKPRVLCKCFADEECIAANSGNVASFNELNTEKPSASCRLVATIARVAVCTSLN